MSAGIEAIKRTMDQLGRMIQKSLPDGLEFVLILRAPNGVSAQASNIHRPRRIELLRAAADKLAGGISES